MEALHTPTHSNLRIGDWNGPIVSLPPIKTVYKPRQVSQGVYLLISESPYAKTEQRSQLTPLRSLLAT